MSTGVVIQARMGSTRLPGKVLMDVCGKSILQRVVERTMSIQGVDEVIVATYKDWDIVKEVESIGGNYLITNSPQYKEDDVLSRYWDVVNFNSGQWQFDTVVRITADCPLLDVEIASRVLENYHKGGYDYYSNCRPKSTFPDGTDVEVFSFEALRQANREARGKEREHVTPFIWNHPHEFKIGRLVNPVDLSHYRMTLDTQDDLDYIRRVYTDLGDSNFGIDAVIGLPYASIRTHEGYFDL